MTKGQMEVLGLVVIVILLALGMFFVAQFTLFKEPSATAIEKESSQIATTFLNTLLTSNAGCGGSTTLSRVVSEIPNREFSVVDCHGQDLESYFVASTENIFGETLNAWNVSYEFNVTYPRGAEVDTIGIAHNCLGEAEREAETFYIPSDYGEVAVTLKICF